MRGGAGGRGRGRACSPVVAGTALTTSMGGVGIHDAATQGRGGGGRRGGQQKSKQPRNVAAKKAAKVFQA